MMYIGIDIGGTNTRIGLFKDRDKLIDEVSFKTKQKYNEAVDDLVKNIDLVSNKTQIKGVGIGICGVIDKNGEQLTVSAQLSDWVAKPLKVDIEKTLKVPVKLENDALVAAVAESSTGYGKNIDRFLYVIWGTGIGGSLVEKINGKLRISPTEWGHQSIDWNGIPCFCGQTGCLENYIGGKAFESLYGMSADKVDDEKIWNKVAEKAAFGIYNTTHSIPVDLIIFGGGLIIKQPHLLKRIEKKLKEKLKVFPVPQLKIAKHGDKNGIFGAASLFAIERI